jgi:hypothetical protein
MDWMEQLVRQHLEITSLMAAASLDNRAFMALAVAAAAAVVRKGVCGRYLEITMVLAPEVVVVAKAGKVDLALQAAQVAAALFLSIFLTTWPARK